MKIDVKNDRRDLYRPGTSDFVEVDVPPARYLAMDGHGDPNTTPAYTAAVEALYAGAYAVRAALKTRTGDELVVGPLEGLWTAEDPAAFTERHRGDWDWTLLLPLPQPITAEDVAEGLPSATKRKPELPVAELHVLDLHEGRCLQILHVGPYDAEGPTLARLHREVMPSRGVTFNGPHHEVYLGDPRRAAPEKLRTVLRQPVRPV